MLKTPVALFVYNRLDTTLRVFERIAEAQPRVLLIVGDGPKPQDPADAEKCAAVRNAVCHPSWPCEVRTHLAAENMGLGRRFSSGLEWVFSEVEESIILEDDCLPEPSFFPYCEELLDRFRHDPRIAMISGDNYQFGRRRSDASYFFSHGVGTYGWATWRRAFTGYDFRMGRWPALRDSSLLSDIWPIPQIAEYWGRCFDATHQGSIDTWDYQWAMTMWSQRGLQVSPEVNLISYIGCVPDAVHTTDPNAVYCNQPTEPLSFPLRHPETVERSLLADVYEFHRNFLGRSHEESVLEEERIGRAG